MHLVPSSLVMAGFLAWCLGIYVLVHHWTKPSHQAEELSMELLWLGGLGGVAIDLWAYQTDFWQPGWGIVGSIGFGALFLSTWSLLWQYWLARCGETLVPEGHKSVSRTYKLLTLGMLIAGWVVLWQGFEWNSVNATSATLLFGAIVLWAERWVVPSAESIHLAVFVGWIMALPLFVVTVGGYLLILSAFMDVDTLARATSSYYVKHGPRDTAGTLGAWASTFGLFWGAALVWGRNLRFRD